MATVLPARLATGVERLLDLLYPPRCAGCAAFVDRHGHLCGDCWGELRLLAPPLCRACGVPLPQGAGGDPLCAGCTARPPAFARARAACAYAGIARRLVLAFKHGERTELAPLLAGFAARAGGELLAACDLIVPVPLHRLRLWRRGFNQSLLLARELARRSGRPLSRDALLRVRRTRSQQGLDAAARRRNVTPAAFAVHPRRRGLVTGRAVLLVDDVLTTGATLESCARVLLRAGAARVDVLVFARVVRDAS